jgi:hypothetical protein
LLEIDLAVVKFGSFHLRARLRPRSPRRTSQRPKRTRPMKTNPKRKRRKRRKRKTRRRRRAAPKSESVRDDADSSFSLETGLPYDRLTNIWNLDYFC